MFAQKKDKKDPKVSKSSAEAPKAAYDYSILDKPVTKEIYVYKSQENRDPFLSIIEKTKRRLDAEKDKTKQRVLMPLERYKLNDLKLLGIVSDGNKTLASIQIPDGKSYNVTIGASIGVENGKISAIQDDKIIIKEESIDYKGERIVRETEMKLREEEE
ncbi:Pilus assembly protein PilP [Candidatus Magnetoovum chiemensis]|nr:Pilus assembly protein PilP [Candidatus Magnetoovum chiemensis]